MVRWTGWLVTVGKVLQFGCGTLIFCDSDRRPSRSGRYSTYLTSWLRLWDGGFASDPASVLAPSLSTSSGLRQETNQQPGRTSLRSRESRRMPCCNGPDRVSPDPLW